MNVTSPFRDREFWTVLGVFRADNRPHASESGMDVALIREQVEAMEAGRAIDLLIERHVIGGFIGGFPTGTVPEVRPYSTDDAAAQEVADKVGIRANPFDGGWVAFVPYDPKDDLHADAPTRALAICRAALLTKIQG